MILKNKKFIKLLANLKEDEHSESEMMTMISMTASHKNYFMSVYSDCSPFDEPSIEDLHINELYYEDGEDFKVYELLPFQYEQCLLKMQDIWHKVTSDNEDEAIEDEKERKHIEDLDVKITYIKR